MSDVWTLVAVVGGATILLKSAGPVFLGTRSLPPALDRMVMLLAPALLAAFVVTQVAGGDRELVLDTRAVGLAVAAAALLMRAPILVVVFAAAAATALVRLLT